MRGGEGLRNITSRRLYWDKMDGLLDLKADLTIYEVGIMNTHTGVDEDPPRDHVLFPQNMLRNYTHHFCCNFDFTRYLRTPLIKKMSLGFLVMYGQRL